MWNTPDKERLAKIPKLYETEEVPLKDKNIHLHFFIAGSDWYISEFDGNDTFWGYAVLNNDFQMAEWGYLSFKEFQKISINGIEIDCELEDYFPIQKAKEIKNICKGNGWKEPGNGNSGKDGYSSEELEILMKQAVFDSCLELPCPNCGSTLRCEPDARDSYCFDCDKVVPTNNPLVAMGLI